MLFTPVLSAKKIDLTLTLYGNYLGLADKNFKDKFTKKMVIPEAKIAMTFRGNLYLWGSYGRTPLSFSYNWSDWSSKGQYDPDISGEQLAEKQIISGGLGFFIGYIQEGHFSLKAEIGICHINNMYQSDSININTQQTIESKSEKETGIGFRGNFGITYGFFKNLFTELNIGYLHAADKIDDVRILLGGLRLSMGIGIKL